MAKDLIGPQIRCQICNNPKLSLALSLGHQPVLQEYLTKEKLQEPEVMYPLNLVFADVNQDRIRKDDVKTFVGNVFQIKNVAYPEFNVLYLLEFEVLKILSLRLTQSSLFQEKKLLLFSLCFN